MDPHSSNISDARLKKCQEKKKQPRRCAAGVCTHTCSREVRWEERSIARAYLMESLKGQAGTDGLWTAGYWKWGSKASQSGESALTVRDHHHCSPHQTTLTAARPPASPPATVPPHQIHLQHGDSVMNLQFCTHMPYMVLLWDLLTPRWKHLQTSGPGRAINQHIKLILAFRRNATRRQRRPKEPKEGGNGGVRALFSAGYRVN